MSDAFEWDVVELDDGITREEALRALGNERPGESGEWTRFAGRAEAEEFLGENWRRLASAGVRSVRLLRAGAPVALVTLAAGE
ncbi:hypothetical protein [Spelaeicoccus albus]|uniref:Uncharacterized protein n=1 Tax=Spelaeicoccus albus TaxID=1280376 RepID=A0A7Z0D3S0_9MICO|nr:hypothetical protein [Spelaeicoccus albus]NYI68337.1 hypothetical protein [Spelaeicoccus albus]